MVGKKWSRVLPIRQVLGATRKVATPNAAAAMHTAVGADTTASRAEISAAARSRSFIWSRSEEHTSELQSLMRISYAVFCLKKKTINTHKNQLNINSAKL